MQGLKQPPWLKKRICLDEGFGFTRSVLREFALNTVCQSARCPNIFDCFSRKRATFLILGGTCTRGCAFCCVKKGLPGPVDTDEPGRVASAASMLGLDHAVITSVTRDDLADGGSLQFARTVDAVRKRCKAGTAVEVLVPDFGGSKKNITNVVRSGPDILGHNVETVPRLYKKTRPRSHYRRSLDLLKSAKEMKADLITKSAVMLGLGETDEEIIYVMRDLRDAGCDDFVMGQYLRPSLEQAGVTSFVGPEKFLELKKIALSLGFRRVQSGPFARSSYS